MQYGWVCPKCGKVLAPWVCECDCQKDDSVTNMTTTTKSVDLSRYYTLINDGTVLDAKFEDAERTPKWYRGKRVDVCVFDDYCGVSQEVIDEVCEVAEIWNKEK